MSTAIQRRAGDAWRPRSARPRRQAAEGALTTPVRRCLVHGHHELELSAGQTTKVRRDGSISPQRPVLLQAQEGDPSLEPASNGQPQARYARPTVVGGHSSSPIDATKRNKALEPMHPAVLAAFPCAAVQPQSELILMNNPGHLVCRAYTASTNPIQSRASSGALVGAEPPPNSAASNRWGPRVKKRAGSSQRRRDKG